MCNCNKEIIDQYKSSYSKYREPFTLEGKKVNDVNGNTLTILEPIRDSYRDIVGYIALNESGETIRISQKLIVKTT